MEDLMPQELFLRSATPHRCDEMLLLRLMEQDHGPKENLWLISIFFLYTMLDQVLRLGL